MARVQLTPREAVEKIDILWEMIFLNFKDDIARELIDTFNVNQAAGRRKIWGELVIGYGFTDLAIDISYPVYSTAVMEIWNDVPRHRNPKMIAKMSKFDIHYTLMEDTHSHRFLFQLYDDFTGMFKTKTFRRLLSLLQQDLHTYGMQIKIKRVGKTTAFKLCYSCRIPKIKP